MLSFQSPQRYLKDFTTEGTASLIAHSSDVSLIIDKRGIVRDVACTGDDGMDRVVSSWIGQAWIDTVTVESRPKIEALLESKNGSSNILWRQVNHPTPDAVDLPVIYKAIHSNKSSRIVAVGRDLRVMSRLQQRLLDVQHSLQQDYARMHQAESRYRMLFNMAAEAILIVDAETRKIVEANPAAGRILDRAPNKLVNRTFPRGFSDNSTDAIDAMLLKVRAAGKAEPVAVATSNGKHRFKLYASLIRRETGPFFLIRMGTPNDNGDEVEHKVLDVVSKCPDAFVVTDVGGRILTANQSFLDLCQAATELQVLNQPLDNWLGRTGVDITLILRTLQERGQVTQFLTTLNPDFGPSINVDLSAVSAIETDDPCFGFVIRRQFQRRAVEESSPDRLLPRSVEEMTELVGRVPLKDLVREATDIIEKMCIEAALKLTGDSRASAAEMLGLSRQSLYVKLRRYGLGDASADE